MRLATTVIALLILPAFLAGQAAESVTSVVHAVRPGPWGQVRYAPLQIAPPTDAVRGFLDEVQDIRWFVMRSGKSEAAAWLKEMSLQDSDIEQLMATAAQTVDARGWLLRPAPELVLGLAPDTRVKFYSGLGQWPENPRHRSPFRLLDHASVEWNDLAGLNAESRARFERLVYARGTLHVFTDLPLMLIALKDDPVGQTRFLRTICSESTYLATLRVMPGDDVDALSRYWGAGGREEDVRPLIEAAARTRGDIEVPLPLLLPGFARATLYTYSTADDMRFLDCHYTSINFFNREADPRLLQGLYRDTFFNAFYREVPEAGQLGDIILLLNPEAQIVHSCVFVAGELVFTKNGGQRTLPWMLMRLDDLREYFSPEGPLKMRIYRRKEAL